MPIDEHSGVFQLETITGVLPHDFAELKEEAGKEGFGFIDRLSDEWSARINCFDKSGERLVCARSGQRFAGIGGITVDPIIPNALRMRRFYIHPEFRRLGLAREICETLLKDIVGFDVKITVNAGTCLAPAFWEAMGFTPTSQTGITHEFMRS